METQTRGESGADSGVRLSNKMRLVKSASVAMFTVAAPLFTTTIAYSQDYPVKSLRVVTSEAGGGLDFAARLISRSVSEQLQQNVIVDNRPIAVMGVTVARAPADGYTMLFAGTTFMIAPLLEKTPYDPLADFAAVTLVARQPNILAVPASFPAKSVKELIAAAKAKPGELNYASSGTGSQAHLATELLKSMAGIDMVHVPYKGVGPALVDLTGGRVQMMIATSASVIPHVKAGRLRALAVTSAEPSALVPGLPTVAAAGLADFEAITIQGMFAPAKTPAARLDRLNREIFAVLNRQEIKDQLINAGVEPVGSSREQLAAVMKATTSRIGRLIANLGLAVR